ncbi:HPP family protein [Ectothiorhodospiraceae bacterium 2226]|nr:HPP family protein [Ectothiorhodospiraceae bacterium 2226]
MKRLFEVLGVEHVPAGHTEKLVSAVGGLLALSLLAVFHGAWNGSAASALLLSSMGASTVLLFAVPHGALSQPWPLVGGHTLSALGGIGSVALLGDPVLAAPLAVGFAIACMYYLRCMHPPGGATALAAVAAGASGQGIGFVFDPVLASALVLLGVALLFNYPFPWRRYPAYLARHRATARAGVSEEDITYALEHVGSFVDVTPEDMADLYRLAREHAKLDQDSPEGSVCCVERGTGAIGLARGLEQCAEGPVFFKVMSLARRNGKPMLVWSKYQVDPDKAPAADDPQSAERG